MFHARLLDTTEKHADSYRCIVLLSFLKFVCDVQGKPYLEATLFVLLFYPPVCFIYIYIYIYIYILIFMQFGVEFLCKTLYCKHDIKKSVQLHSYFNLTE
jgi:hypothetical protein